MPTPAIGRLCFDCKHLRRDWTCEAFSRGIPAVILRGESDHLEPVRGDHGMVFEKRESPADMRDFISFLDEDELPHGLG